MADIFSATMATKFIIFENKFFVTKMVFKPKKSYVMTILSILEI